MVAGGGNDDERGAANGNGGSRPVFRGVSELLLDAKGRVAIPARHRDGLAGDGGRIVITADHGGCLLVYPQATWEPIQAELMALSSFDDRIRSVQRKVAADRVPLASRRRNVRLRQCLGGQQLRG